MIMLIIIRDIVKDIWMTGWASEELQTGSYSNGEPKTNYNAQLRSTLRSSVLKGLAVV
jgi:hypothetical protein